MANNFSLLDKLVANLRKAVKERDWEELGRLDQSVRDEIERLINSGVADEDFQSKITSMASEYARLSEEVVQIRDGIGAELRKLNQDHRAINQYLNNK